MHDYEALIESAYMEHTAARMLHKSLPDNELSRDIIGRCIRSAYYKLFSGFLDAGNTVLDSDMQDLQHLYCVCVCCGVEKVDAVEDMFVDADNCWSSDFKWYNISTKLLNEMILSYVTVDVAVRQRLSELLSGEDVKCT